MFSGHSSGKITLWNVSLGTEIKSVTLSGNIYNCYFINNNKNIIFTQENNKICIHKSSTLEEDFSISTSKISMFIMT